MHLDEAEVGILDKQALISCSLLVQVSILKSECIPRSQHTSCNLDIVTYISAAAEYAHWCPVQVTEASTARLV
jgi:hypothetical protein